MSKNKFKSGQTIIEVLIATTVVALVLTTIVAALSLSVRNTSQSRYRILAGNLTTEGLETFRRFRDRMGWDSFYSTMAAQTGRYCINDLPANQSALDDLVLGECTDTFPVAGANFQREVVIAVTGPSEAVTLTFEVSWEDGNVTRISSYTQELRDIR